MPRLLLLMVTLSAVEGLALAAAQAAEPVTLVFPSGGRLSGVLLDESRGLYVLERDGGQLEFPHAAVAEVVRAPNAEGEFRAREAALPPKDVAALWDLALFAAENGLTGRAERTARRVLALDMNHAGARATLGYERVFGQWVRHEGRRVTRPREEDYNLPPLPPRYDGLVAAINSLTAQLAVPRTAVTRIVFNDGGAAALAIARRAHVRFGRPEGEEQGAQPWRPEPFRVGSTTLGIPPMDPVGSRIGY